MKNWFWIGGVVLAGIAFFFILKNNRSFEKVDVSKGPIVAFGDSLIYGIGAQEGEGFVAQLSTKIEKPIINMGVPGNTTADGLARLNTILALNPSLVLVLLGGNDYLRRVPVEQTFANLDTIVMELTKRDIGVVLLGVQGGVLSDPFEKEFQKLAKKHDIPYVSNVLDGVIMKKELMNDMVHPNKAGYTKIADKVYPVLAKIILGS